MKFWSNVLAWPFVVCFLLAGLTYETWVVFKIWRWAGLEVPITLMQGVLANCGLSLVIRQIPTITGYEPTDSEKAWSAFRFLLVTPTTILGLAWIIKTYLMWVGV